VVKNLDIKPGDKIKVEFETMALGGKAKGAPVGYPPGSWAVFAGFAAPEEKGIVKVNKVVKRFVEGELVKVTKPSPFRILPQCEYFGKCGGCNWQHIDYKKQLSEKSEIISYVLARNEIRPEINIKCLPSHNPLGYRGRADITFIRKGKKLIGGFLKHHSHELLDVDICPLLVKPLSEKLEALKVALYDLVVHIPQDWPFKARILFDEKSDGIYCQPRLKGRLAEGLIGTYRLDGSRLTEAEQVIMSYEIDGEKIYYNPYCFTQIDINTNRTLVKTAVNALDLKPDDVLLELYSGIGNFTMPIARRSERVLAVESSHASIGFSKTNAKKNGLKNIEHMRMDSSKACRKLARQGRGFNKVLVDPPRFGMGQEAVNNLCDLEPRMIVSVSCHPNTLAKDLKSFVFRGYDMESVTGVDMFGQTFHVETVTVLRRRA